MRILELFSGSGSIGQAFGSKGWEVVSRRFDQRKHPNVGPHGVPDRVFRRCLGQPVLYPVQLRPPWCKDPPKFGFGRCPRETVPGHHRVFPAANLVLRESGDRSVKNSAVYERAPLVRRRLLLFFRVGLPEKDPAVEQLRLSSEALRGTGSVSQHGVHGDHHSTKHLYRIPPNLCSEIEPRCRALVLSNVLSP